MKKIVRTSALLAILSLLLSCGKKDAPKPPAISISAILGGTWTTQSVVCTKPDGTTTTITDQATIEGDLLVGDPTFQTTPSGGTLGTANDKLFGENFSWSYASSSNTIDILIDQGDMLLATITTLSAHTMVWETTGTNGEFGSAYTKVVQTFTR